LFLVFLSKQFITPVVEGSNTPTVSPACRMRRLKEDWYRWQHVHGVGLRWPPVETPQSIAGETAKVWSKRCHYSQTSCALSPPHSSPFLIWCDILLTGSHHSTAISILILFHLNSSILPPRLLPTCTIVRGNHHQGKLIIK